MRALKTIIFQEFKVGREFGSLTVGRIYDEGSSAFCTCICGSSRTVTRKQLTSGSIDSCKRCANFNRLHKNRRQFEPPLPPEPEAPKPEKPKCVPGKCTVYRINGRPLVGHDPDCPTLNVFKPVSQKADTRVYPSTVISGR